MRRKHLIVLVLVLGLASLAASCATGDGGEDTVGDTTARADLHDVTIEYDAAPADVNSHSGDDVVIEDTAGFNTETADTDLAPDAEPDSQAPPIVGPAGEFGETIDVDGIGRAYQLYAPQSAVSAMAQGPVPLLFALHGAGDNGLNFIAATGLKDTASANGFVLVGGQAYNAAWFLQPQEGWPEADGNGSSLQNDAEMMLRIIEATALDYWIDQSRVYVVGHSRGAGCTALFAMLSGGMTVASGPWNTPFAAYAINAGYDATGGQVDLSQSIPKRPVWIIHGTADGVVPYADGKALADAFLAAGWAVTLTTVDGGGHTWLWRTQYGQSNQDLWDFFMSHTAKD